MVSDNPETFADLDGHDPGSIYIGDAAGYYACLVSACGAAQKQQKEQNEQQKRQEEQRKAAAQHQNATQNQSNQQTQNNQQSTSGINPNYKLPTSGTFLKKASDFSAGAGDFLSFGLTEKFRQHYGYDSVVDKKSGAYFTGQMTGLGVSAAKLTAGIETKIAIHGAEHAFPLIGEVPHLQIMWWIAGAARQMMGSPIRIPLAPWWP